MTDPIKIPFEGDEADFVASAKKVQAEMDAVSAKLKAAGVSQAAYNKVVADSAKAVKANTMSWTDFRSMYQTVLDVVRVGQAVWTEFGQKFVDNAVEVGNLARAMGTTTEEASRLKEVADDVGISTDSLRTSLKLAAKDGFEPTIESIAQMADEYNTLAPGTERMQFLLDRFGKSGEEMGKLLEKGGTSIRNMAAAMDEGLVVTEAAYEQARKYQVSVDALKDSWDALTYKAAPPLVNAVTEVVNATRDHTRALEIMEEQGMSTYHAVGSVGYVAALDAAIAERELADATLLAAESAEQAGGAFEDEAEKAKRLAEEEKLAAEAAKEISEANTQFLSVLENVSNAQETFTTGMAEADAALAAGTMTVEEHSAKVNQLSADYQEAGKQIVMEIVKMKLASDGWTNAELDAYLRIGQSQGQFTEQQVAMAQAAIYTADQIVAGVSQTEGPMLHVGERAKDNAEYFGDMADAGAELGESMRKEVAAGAAAATSAITSIPTQWTTNVDIYIRQHGSVPSFLTGNNATGGITLCFVAGTLVTLSDGTRKPIEQLQPGDEVRSYNLERREFVSGKVSAVMSRDATEYLNLDGILVTDEHPFYVANRREWVKAKDIKRNDFLLRDNGGMKVVSFVFRVNEPATVYNLTVDGEHNYFAGGVLVHNKSTEELEEEDSGGPGTKGGVYMINPKAGPELFVAPSDGQFMPNADRLFDTSGIIAAIQSIPQIDYKTMARAIDQALQRRGY